MTPPADDIMRDRVLNAATGYVELGLLDMAWDELNSLTEREHEVLDLLAQGLTNKEIAEKLVITTNTVKRHLKAIFEKRGVHTRSAATAKV